MPPACVSGHYTRRIVVRLRLHLADGRETLLSAEVDAPPETPELFLEQFNRHGEIRLGDRETVPFTDVVKVEFAPVEPQTAPPWLGDLRDEDVASAMEERFDKPVFEEPS
jgi:hypothetical protein